MVGERLAELRKDKRLSQQELADIMMVSKNTISSYERDLSTPDDDMKVKIAQYFNVSLDYLMGVSKIPYTLNAERSRLLLMDLPAPAVVELDSFLAYLKGKYKL